METLLTKLLKEIPSLDWDCYNSDLYVEDNPKVREIIKEHYTKVGVDPKVFINPFRCNVTKKPFIDVPFGVFSEDVYVKEHGEFAENVKEYFNRMGGIN